MRIYFPTYLKNDLDPRIQNDLHILIKIIIKELNIL
jgi:hypothetical protein